MSRPYAAEVFAGSGLFGLGLELEGIHVGEQCEWKPDAVETLRANMAKVSDPPPRIHLGDARQWTPKVPRRGLDLLVGGPPCQPWSKAGKRRGPDDPRDMFPQTLRWAREIRPRVMVWENTAGIFPGPGAKQERQLKWGAYWANYFRTLDELRYVHVVWKVRAADYGTPQVRDRVFIVAWVEEEDEVFRPVLSEPPPATHASPKRAKALGLPVWVPAFSRLHGGCCGGYGFYSCAMLNNLGDVCSSCIDGDHYQPVYDDDDERDSLSLTRGALEYLLEDPERLSVKHVPTDMGGYMPPRPRRWYLGETMVANMGERGVPYGLVIDQNASVQSTEDLRRQVRLQARGGPKVLRGLTVREAAKLQDAPQWWDFESKVGERTLPPLGFVSEEDRERRIKQKLIQIGNAVPVNLGRAVGRHLMRALKPRRRLPVIAEEPYTGLWPTEAGNPACQVAYLRSLEARGADVRMAQLELVLPRARRRGPGR